MAVAVFAVLEAAGLVRTRRNGRYTFHSADAALLSAVLSRWLNEEIQS